MKEGIVLYLKSLNLGDDIQGYAAAKFCKEDFVVLDRENLNSTKNAEPIKLICNGWFLDHPENWPPNPFVHPLFISFHIGKYRAVRKKLINPGLVDYYRQFAPIGCRDMETAKLFEGIGIANYFSGCLTLTLPASTADRNKKILIVDPFVNNILEPGYAKRLMLKLVPKQFHDHVEFITHVRETANHSAEERLFQAEQLLERYAKAKMVITSRIHCALPCLALDTPVYFMDVGYERQKDRDRFDGILNLFHVLQPNLPFHGNRRIDKVIKMLGLHKLFFNSVLPLSIDFEQPEPNKKDYLKLRDQLKSKVKEFLATVEDEVIKTPS